MNLLQHAVFTKLADHTTAGTADVTSAILDMAGYQGVVFVTSLSVANANNYLVVQQDIDPAGGTMADLADSKVVSGASDEDLDSAKSPGRPCGTCASS